MADETRTNIKSGIDTAANAAKKLTDRGAEAVNRTAGVNTRDNGQSVLDKAGDYAQQAKEKVGEWAGDAREAVGEFADHAGEKAQKWAGQAYDAAAGGVSDFGREVNTLVRNHPLPAVLIGFGLGLLLGRAARIV